MLYSCTLMATVSASKGYCVHSCCTKTLKTALFLCVKLHIKSLQTYIFYNLHLHLHRWYNTRIPAIANRSRFRRWSWFWIKILEYLSYVIAKMYRSLIRLDKQVGQLVETVVGFGRIGKIMFLCRQRCRKLNRPSQIKHSVECYENG